MGNAAPEKDHEIRNMQTAAKRPYYSAFSIALGIWFCLTSWLWVYYMNIVFSFPAALLGMFLWWKGRNSGEHPTVNKIALYVHITGLVISLTALAFLL